MNMISTGAFLNEMDSSSKQPTLAEKFAAVWEKKNAKAARAGGVSLMALSLAACGSSSDTSTPATPTTPTTPTTPAAPEAQSFALSALVDDIDGGDGDDSISAAEVMVNGTVTNSLTALDNIDGGAGTDTLTITESDADITAVPSVTVTNVEKVVLNAAKDYAANINTWSGVETLTADIGDAADLTVSATTDVVLTGSSVAADTTAVNGGKDITITQSGITDTAATIAVGATTAAKGAVTVTQTTAFTDAGGDDTAGTIQVTGGTSVNITQNLVGASDASQGTDGSSETFTGGAVTVTGTADTTNVTVTQTGANTAVNYAVATAATAAATGTLAVAGETGVVNGAVTVNDVNRTSLLDAGKITEVTLNNYGASTINSGALSTVNISGTGGTLGLTAGALTTANVSALTINASEATAGAITADADYTTINVAGSTGTSTIANLTATGATTLNVSGDAKVTFTAQTLAAVTDINVTNTAGVSLGTAIGNAVTFDAVGGVDAVKVGATTKAIAMGGGNDTVTVNVAALGTAGSIAGGDGTDTLVMTGANAATATSTVTFGNTISGFEALKVNGTTANTARALNMANLDSINAVTIDGEGDHTISGITPGFALSLMGSPASTTDTVLNLSSAAGSSDSITVSLANNTGGALDFGTLNAAAVETIAITTSDTGTVAAGRQYATIDVLDLTAADATTITVSGNNGLNMGTNTAAKITSFDASGVAGDNSTEDIAANLAVTYTSGNATAGANLTLKGGAGNDTLTANKNADTITGGAGNDTLAGGAGADSIDGGTGTDTYKVVAAQIGANVEGAGTGTSTGVAINLGTTAVTGAAVLSKTLDYLTQGGSLAAGTAAYLYGGDLSTNSAVVDTLTSIESIDASQAGVYYIVGSAEANTINLGVTANVTADDYVDGGAKSDTINITADGDATGAVFEDLVAVEKIALVADGNNTAKVTLQFTSADTTAIEIDATALTGGTANLTLVASDAEVDGALTIKGSAGDDTLGLGDGADVIVFAGTTAATNGSDTITAHQTNDVYDLSGVLSSGAIANATSGTAVTLATQLALATQATSIAVTDQQVYLAEIDAKADIDTVGELVTALADGGKMDAVDVAVSSEAIIIVGGANDDNTHYIYGINNDTNAAVIAGEIALLATVTTDITGGMDGLLTSNFDFTA